MKDYSNVDDKVKATGFDFDEAEEIDDPVRLVLEEYVKPRKNKK